MSKRDEPEILADLIRLAEMFERDAAEFDIIAAAADSENAKFMATSYAAELRKRGEVCEQARAALHRHVIDAGRRQLGKNIVSAIGLIGLFSGFLIGLALGLAI